MKISLNNKINNTKMGEIVIMEHSVVFRFGLYSKTSQSFFLDLQKFLLKYYNLKCLSNRVPKSIFILPEIKNKYKMNKYNVSRSFILSKEYWRKKEDAER